ncbi:MAG: hydantoinase B/oxoprolinase family protein, partial [Dehalococcoidia bacterium]
MKEKKELDPITFGVIANRFDSITRTMLNTMQRTARTTALSVARDFSASILTPQADLVFIAEGIPIHVMTSHWAVKPVLELFDDIAPGDLYINNAPYWGNSHHGDYTHFVPVFNEGKLVVWLVLRVHQGDCGCAEPTSYLPWAPDLYWEGIHWPVVRFQRDCKDVKDVIRIARERIRAPDLWYGNYLATVGGLRVGEREIIKLCQRFDNDVVEQFLDQWLDYGDRRMEQEIRSLPKGTWVATTKTDPQPYAPEGIPLKMTLTIDPDDAKIIVDLRDNPDQVPGGINLTHANSAGTTLAGIFFCLDNTIPHNTGAYRHIEVLLREGCICGIPIHPAGTSTATTYIAERCANLSLNCMAQAAPHKGAAEGPFIDRGIDVISGYDHRYENRYYIQHILSSYGGG